MVMSTPTSRMRGWVEPNCVWRVIAAFPAVGDLLVDRNKVGLGTRVGML